MRIFILCTLLGLGSSLLAQNRYQLGLLPSVNISKKVSDDWKFNLKVEFRQLLQEGVFGDESALDYNYVLTDYALVAARKVGLNNSLAGGYLLRIREGELIHRLIQQFVITQRKETFRMAHRFVTDQTFASNEAVTIRLRYRLSSEFPLNGQSVDPGETYLKVNQEILSIWQYSDYNLELRLLPFIGYQFTDNNKLEVGLDYRIDAFLENGSRQRFWGAVGWYRSL